MEGMDLGNFYYNTGCSIAWHGPAFGAMARERMVENAEVAGTLYSCVNLIPTQPRATKFVSRLLQGIE